MNDGHNDYTDEWDCAPPRDDGWIDEYVKLHVDNELRRVSWTERQKKSQALRAKLGLGWPQAFEE